MLEKDILLKDMNRKTAWRLCNIWAFYGLRQNARDKCFSGLYQTGVAIAVCFFFFGRSLINTARWCPATPN
jgi:hypothetical protein